MRRSSFASRWLILVLVFVVCLSYVLTAVFERFGSAQYCLFTADICQVMTFFNVFPFYRFKNHRKALVTSVDKKIPNGFLEERGTVLLYLIKPPVHENNM